MLQPTQVKKHHLEKSEQIIMQKTWKLQNYPYQHTLKAICMYKILKLNYQGYHLTLSKCPAYLNQYFRSIMFTSKSYSDFPMKKTFKARNLHQNMTMWLF